MASRKWFHHKLGGIAAEKLLMERGYEGSYLVRPSKSNPGDFTLSVRRGDAVTHIKIQNTGECFDLYGGEKFATLTELVNHYTSGGNELKETNGAVIKLVAPLVSSDPTSERWFHGGIGGLESERILKEQGDRGSFLVRPSVSKPGEFVLSVRGEDSRITHVKIRCTAGKYDVGGGDKFDTLSTLVEHYKSNPMVETSGNVLELVKACNATKVAATNIIARCKELEKEQEFGGGFVEEFEQLQEMELKLVYPRTEGQRPENKTKNRYKNILPFDYTRVKLLDVDPAVVGSDYINANFIKGEASGVGNDYIACQGCLKATIEAFWQMIWENKNRIIVMTTAVVEKGKSKCAPYWPPPDGPVMHGKYIIAPSRAKELHDYILREMILQKDGDDEPPRTIYQYHFKAWPDHGVPRDPSAVLQFLLLINKEMDKLRSTLKEDLGQLVVHCSAGIGRTGTFIVIDILLRVIEQRGTECEIDIQHTIQRVRGQRSGLIQTEAQYAFVYQAISQHVSRIQDLERQALQGPDASELYGNLEHLTVNNRRPPAQQPRLPQAPMNRGPPQQRQQARPPQQQRGPQAPMNRGPPRGPQQQQQRPQSGRQPMPRPGQQGNIGGAPPPNLPPRRGSSNRR
eukprot:m.337547 g.337547  ORF g.337547 m.337547 type:complete len:627 (-) comp18161_c0_seq1:158-2038(-)